MEIRRMFLRLPGRLGRRFLGEDRGAGGFAGAVMPRSVPIFFEQ